MNEAEMLPLLNKELLLQQPTRVANAATGTMPERVLQFGEGNFLRGFADWMIHGMNQQGLFNGKVVVVQPVAHGMVSKLNEQDGLFTLLMRGIHNGEVVEKKQLISSISRGIDPYTDYRGFLECASNPDLRWIISNTTEAGIAFDNGDRSIDHPPSSFPAKLTVFLMQRYRAFCGDMSKGFVILPCELIDRNGDKLKETVLHTATNWQLDPEFIEWIEKANIFTNTLVDRIVTGYPKDEAAAICKEAGYQDNLVDCAEVYHLWVIEGPKHLADEFPAQQAGFNVIWTDDMTPYRERKVCILNGAHTATVLAGYLAGEDYVGEMMKNPVASAFMKKAIHEEVIPTLSLPKGELEDFADAVFERFSNPFIKHALLSISLNSVSKFRSRVLPSIERYVKLNGTVPPCLSFSLAALIAFYRGTELRESSLICLREGVEYRVHDDPWVLAGFLEMWTNCDETPEEIEILTEDVLRRVVWWGRDLREIEGLQAAVAGYLTDIMQSGMKEALQQVLLNAEATETVPAGVLTIR